jgi:hypothetical protein
MQIRRNAVPLAIAFQGHGRVAPAVQIFFLAFDSDLIDDGVRWA